MITNKKIEFDKIFHDIADFARALSHPARLMILKNLAKEEKCICGEIVKVLPLAQSTVSQHLKELKKTGLIRGEIDGPRSCYCIDWENFDKSLKILNELMRELKQYKKDISC